MSILSNLLDGASTALGFVNPTSTVAKAVTGGLTSFIKGASADSQLQASLDAQRKLQQEANQFELEMWERNNEYNSIGAQLERAKAAGVSPNALLGGSYSSATSNPVSYNAMPQPQNLASEIYNQDTLAKRVQLANAKKTEQEATGKETENAFQKATFETRVKILDKEFETIVKELGMKDIEERLLTAQADEKEAFNKWFASKSEIDLQLLAEQLKQAEELTSQAKEQTTQAGIQTDIMQSQKDVEASRAAFAKAAGVPLGSTVFELLYSIYKKDGADSFNEFLKVLGMQASLSLASDAGSIFNGAVDRVFERLNPLNWFGGKGRKRNSLHRPKTDIFIPDDNPVGWD